MARILVVDDSVYQRIKLRKVLETAAFEVVDAVDGEEGLQMAANRQPDCILLDLLMPKIGGIEVLSELKRKGLTVPVVIHTSDIQDTTRADCLALGAVGFINKPATQEDLLAAIALALQSQDGRSKNDIAA